MDSCKKVSQIIGVDTANSSAHFATPTGVHQEPQNFGFLVGPGMGVDVDRTIARLVHVDLKMKKF